MHDVIGLNSRLDELHAAILHDALLPHLAGWTARRRQIAAAYQEQISNPAIELIRPRDTANPGWHLFPVLVTNGKRDALREYLRSAGIATGIHYPTVIPDQPALKKFANYEIAIEPKRARAIAAAELSLPIHPFISSDAVDAVVTACNRWPG